MGRRCVAAGCFNTHSDSISMHKFPKDPELRLKMGEASPRAHTGKSSEVKGSYHMKKEGLQRVLQFMQEQNITVNILVTDKHKQINKWLRETYPSITHYFDTWHVAKGFHEKLDAAAAAKDCTLIREWQRSILNHLYWCVASTEDGDSETVLAKWLSLDNHVHDKHQHDSPNFSQCVHGRLSKRKWFIRHTKPSKVLSALISDKNLWKDILRLSPIHQTSSLESFHSVLNHFAPKMKAFHYPIMMCRVQIAVLHFNENSNREQATTLEGEERFDLLFPKYKGGGYVVKKVKVDPTFEYVDDLMVETMRRCREHNIIAVEPESIPPPLSSQYERPDKQEAILHHKSRFSL